MLNASASPAAWNWRSTLFDLVDGVQECGPERGNLVDGRVDVLRGADAAGIGPASGGGDQGRRPGIQRCGPGGVEDGKGARLTNRNFGATHLETVVGAAGLSYLVLALLPVVRHLTLLPSSIPEAPPARLDAFPDRLHNR
jgi:hypothetical protein